MYQNQCRRAALTESAIFLRTIAGASEFRLFQTMQCSHSRIILRLNEEIFIWDATEVCNED